MSESGTDLFADPVARCKRCGRATWHQEAIGRIDTMPQPDGGICGGVFVAVSR